MFRSSPLHELQSFSSTKFKLSTLESMRFNDKQINSNTVNLLTFRYIYSNPGLTKSDKSGLTRFLNTTALLGPKMTLNIFSN